LVQERPRIVLNRVYVFDEVQGVFFYRGGDV
jgi:hypothetical protein